MKQFKFIGKGWKKELISVNNGGGGHCGGLDGIIKTLNLQNKVKKTKKKFSFSKILVLLHVVLYILNSRIKVHARLTVK